MGTAAPAILQSIEGPVAKIIAVIIIITTGLTLAFGDTSGGFRRLIQIVFGLSIAFAASSFFPVVLSFGGGRWSDGGSSSIRAERCRAFTVPVHRALRTDPARRTARAIAIMNGTLAGALGLGLRLWLVGIAHLGDRPFRGGLGGKRDPLFVEVGRRHLRIPRIFRSGGGGR